MIEITQIVDFIRDLHPVIKYTALTLCVAIEYILPIFPGDTIVLLSGFLSAHGALDLIDLSLCIIAGSLIGAFLAYELGAFFIREPYRYAWVKRLVESKSYQKFIEWYEKWGSVFLILNRFFPGIRALFFVAAGAIRIPIAKVLIFGGLSALIFNASLFGLGYWLGYNSDLIIEYFYQFNIVLILIMLVGLGMWVWWLKKNRT